MGGNVQEKINKLVKELYEEEFTIANVILANVPKNIKIDDVVKQVVFDMVVVPEGHRIEDVYVKSCEGMSISFCRCVGGTVDEALPKGERVKKVYCIIEVSGLQMDGTYLQCIINEYYKVIEKWVSTVINAAEWHEDSRILDTVRTREKDRKGIYDNISNAFRKHMVETYGINIDIITEISGTYYEGSACNSAIFFDLADYDREVKEKLVLELEEPVEIKEENIRKIRKLLEIGNSDCCLAAYWIKRHWAIVGLYKKGNSGKKIAFWILRHMVWHMEIMGREAVYYKCGKYTLECEAFRKNEFKRKYTDLFQKTCQNSALKVFEGAVKQEHGTIVVILERDRLDGPNGEIDRLLENSAGIGIKCADFSPEYIHSITSIDGAAIFDEDGRCYAIGVILDGKADEKGEEERGARYNSVLKYIKMCKTSKYNMKALAVVVSEDKTIDILDTNMEER